MSHVIINADNIWCEVLGDQNVHTTLYDILKYHPPGYKHVYRYINGSWDGYNRLYDINYKRFRRGLLNRVVRSLSATGYTISVVEATASKLPASGSFSLANDVIKPYDFQSNIRSIIKQHNMGIITSPTGSGKTVMLAILLDELRLKSLVLVTDLVLLDQMQLALSKYFNTDIGIIGDGEFDLKDITVSTVQSILSMYKSGSSSAVYKKAKFLDWIDSVGVVVSDEAHLYDSDGVAQIMPLFKQSSRFYGLSATPYGWSGKSEQRSNLELEQHFGEIIYDTRKLDFISLGLRVPLVVDVVNNTPVNIKYRNHMKRIRGKLVPDHGKNYAECLSTEILTRGEYHQMVADKVAELNSLGMTVFVHAAHTIAFGDAITKLIPGAEFVSGSTPRQRRREIYQAMRDGQLQTIVSDVGGTGLDIPSLGAIVLASDLQDVRQIVGRVIRKSQNKDYGMVVDFRTDCDYLSKHADTRRYQYEYENAIITNS